MTPSDLMGLSYVDSTVLAELMGLLPERDTVDQMGELIRWAWGNAQFDTNGPSRCRRRLAVNLLNVPGLIDQLLDDLDRCNLNTCECIMAWTEDLQQHHQEVFGEHRVGQQLVKKLRSRLALDAPSRRGGNARPELTVDSFRKLSVLPSVDELQQATNVSESTVFLAPRDASRVSNAFQMLRAELLFAVREAQKGDAQFLITHGRMEDGGLKVQEDRSQSSITMSFLLPSWHPLRTGKKKGRAGDFWRDRQSKPFRRDTLIAFFVTTTHGGQKKEANRKLLGVARIVDDSPKMLSSSKDPGRVVLGLGFSSRDVFVELLLRMQQPQSATNVSAVPLRVALFAMEPILKSLKGMRSTTFHEMDDLPTAVPHEVDEFGWTAEERRNCKLDKDVLSRFLGTQRHLRHTFDPRQSKSGFDLDAQQRQAVFHALTDRVSVVQGPPGTGKSLVGAVAVREILDNFDGARVLVLTVTNHALDSFIEDLEGEGVTDIVRLGGQSKNRRVEPYQLANIALDSTSDKEGRAAFRAASVQIDSDRKVLHRLKAEGVARDANDPKDKTETLFKWLQRVHPRDAEAFSNTTAARERSFVNAKRDTPMSMWRAGKTMPGNVVNSPKSRQLWGLPKDERTKRIREWRAEQGVESLELLYSALDCEAEHLADRSAVHEKSVPAMCSRRVIAATTTGSAMRCSQISDAKPTHLVVEEAGETLEAHVLACLSPSIVSVLLIGDHFQLRPRIDTYELKVESQRGFSLDKSLFERLATGRAIDPTVLQIQHRMPPEISSPLRRTYPQLKDGPKTADRDGWTCFGLPKNVRTLVVSHRKMEDGVGGKATPVAVDAETGTVQIGNAHEVDMVYGFVQLLLAQGYEASQMVVLTPYLGQVRQLTDRLKGLSALDRRDLSQLLSAEGKDQSEQHDSVNVLNDATSDKVRVATIDNFQGEESDVIIISWVRSGRKGDTMGFLDDPNRHNVAVSRARQVMLRICNHEFLAESSRDKWRRHSRESGKDMWKAYFDSPCVHVMSDVVPLKCQRHPDHLRQLPVELISPEQLSCPEPCMTPLDCGHRCSLRCHSPEHDHNCTATGSVSCEKNVHIVENVRCNGDPAAPFVVKQCGECKKEEHRRRQDEAAAQKRKVQEEARLNRERAELEKAVQERTAARETNEKAVANWRFLLVSSDPPIDPLASFPTQVGPSEALEFCDSDLLLALARSLASSRASLACELGGMASSDHVLTLRATLGPVWIAFAKKRPVPRDTQDLIELRLIAAEDDRNERSNGLRDLLTKMTGVELELGRAAADALASGTSALFHERLIKQLERGHRAPSPSDPSDQSWLDGVLGRLAGMQDPPLNRDALSEAIVQEKKRNPPPKGCRTNVGLVIHQLKLRKMVRIVDDGDSKSFQWCTPSNTTQRAPPARAQDRVRDVCAILMLLTTNAPHKRDLWKMMCAVPTDDEAGQRAAQLLVGTSDDRAELCECSTCSNVVPKSKSVWCNDPTPHYICIEDCAAMWIGTVPCTVFVDRSDSITCCMSTTQPGCRIGLQQVLSRGASHVGDAIHQKVKEGYETISASQVELEVKRRVAAIAAMDELGRAKRAILDHVLTLHCPRCKTAFFDFDGCMALTCSKPTCGCGFCAICLEDCGADAHAHVAGGCKYQPGTFGDANTVKKLQARAKRDRLTDHLQRLGDDLAGRVRAELAKEIAELEVECG